VYHDTTHKVSQSLRSYQLYLLAIAEYAIKRQEFSIRYFGIAFDPKNNKWIIEKDHASEVNVKPFIKTELLPFTIQTTNQKTHTKAKHYKELLDNTLDVVLSFTKEMTTPLLDRLALELLGTSSNNKTTI